MNKNFENITQRLKDKDYRLTDIRKAVIKVLTIKEHVSINDIINFLKEEGNETINIMSIYNTIDLLIEEHIIHANIFEGKQIIYELSENGIHIICNYCNSIIHVNENRKNQQNAPLHVTHLEKLATENNFSFSHYKLEIHGICRNCQLKSKKMKF
ncbi:Fur family transcriptional regulator [Spiroplasma endosymbiont of Virgichneumon dumeticola]|uniref:Fur family transcriptional regulator n=1 Tax=Spiroplasma endosymbiont of Virgichneumon dumeticola TaxID=3139323 RepID=UPI0035C91660